MTSYLFVTNPAEYQPEEVKRWDISWSCAKTTEIGDKILVYLTGNIGVKYEWRAVSASTENPVWGFVCDVTFVSEFDPPITIQEICGAVSRDEWAPPHLNFRGNKAIRIPDIALEKILALRE